MKRLFNNTVFSSIDALVLVVLNLLATPVLIKNLGVAEYGVFVFLSMFSTYGILSVFGLGMEGALLNYVARYESDGDNQKIQNSLTISLIYYGIIGLIVGFALYFLADYIASRFLDESGTLNLTRVLLATKIISVNVFLQFLSFPLTAVLQGLRRYVITKSINTILTVAQYTSLIIVTIVYHRIDLAFAIILGITVIRVLVLLYIVVFTLPHFRPMCLTIDFTIVKSLFGYSSILFISRVIGIVFNQMDKFLIWLYLAVSQMAIYDIAVRPANLIRLLIGILNSAVIPEVARLHQNQENGQIRTLFINLVRYAYLIIIPVLVVTFVHMESLLQLWVGAELSQYYYLALIILVVYLLAPIVSMASTVIVGLELVRKSIWISLVASGINVILSLALIGPMGLAGLLFATLVAELFMVFPYLHMMKKVSHLQYGKLMQPIFTILVTACPFVLLHVWIRALWLDSTYIVVGTMIFLLPVHFLVNYRFFLQREERVYVLHKLGLGRTRLIQGAY